VVTAPVAVLRVAPTTSGSLPIAAGVPTVARVTRRRSGSTRIRRRDGCAETANYRDGGNDPKAGRDAE
jgi:hypothetical protein